MPYIIDHDFHIHSGGSMCSGDPEQTPARILQYAVDEGFSAVALTALRPLVRKHLTPKLTATNIDSVIGSLGIVTGTIDNLTATGQVKLNGMEWTARSTSGQPLEVGTKVRVDKIEGVKVFVSPTEVPARV